MLKKVSYNKMLFVTLCMTALTLSYMLLESQDVISKILFFEVVMYFITMVMYIEVVRRIYISKKKGI